MRGECVHIISQVGMWCQQEMSDVVRLYVCSVISGHAYSHRHPLLLLLSSSQNHLMMTYSIFKSFTIGTFLFALAPSAAFSPSSSLKVDATQRLKSDLMYRKNIQIDARNVTSTVISTTSAQFKTNKVAAPKKAKHLVKIDFKKDLSKHLDVTLPYYSLENENAIVDDITGECHGIICTVKRDAPIGRETGEIAMFDFLRAAGCVCTTAAVLANPLKKRHHYPAEVYSVDANPAHDHDKWLKKEISSIANCEAFLEEASDPVFFMT